jgi:hypothetical protein
MRPAILAIFLTFVACTAVATAQPVPSVPGSLEDVAHPAVHYVISITFVDPAKGMTGPDIVNVLSYLATEPARRAQFTSRAPLMEQFMGFGEGTSVQVTPEFSVFIGIPIDTPSGTDVQLMASDASKRDAVAALGKRIVEELSSQKVPREQRDKRVREIDEQLANLKDKMELLHSISLNTAQLGPEILKDRIKSAELERQRLEMDLVAQHKRSGAITDQIQRIKKEADMRIDTDPVLKQLREVVPLREEEVKRVQKMFESGQASQSEASAVRDTVLQANIRVAEREEALRQSTQAGLLERLNEELATIMIDQAEKQVRLELLRSQQPSIDVKDISEDKLDRLTDQYRALFRNPGTLPPLYFELEKRTFPLRVEKLALLVRSAKVTDAPATTQPAR